MYIMAFYLDFLLDVSDPTAQLAYPVNVVGYDVAAIVFAIPKTFNNTVEFARLRANFVSTQPFYDGQNLLLTTAIHDSHRGKIFTYEPVNPQYRPMSCRVLTDIRFAVVDEKNEPIEFDSGKMLVVLHFIPKY